MTCLSSGMQAKGIARALGITLHTCRGYIKSIHLKLGVSSQLEAVIKAQSWDSSVHPMTERRGRHRAESEFAASWCWRTGWPRWS